jgi:hypothetical protein
MLAIHALQYSLSNEMSYLYIANDIVTTHPRPSVYHCRPFVFNAISAPVSFQRIQGDHFKRCRDYLLVSSAISASFWISICSSKDLIPNSERDTFDGSRGPTH